MKSPREEEQGREGGREERRRSGKGREGVGLARETRADKVGVC